MTRPHIPQEISDYIVDFLHDEKKTLRQCCLVSKSWVPRAQQHLFYEISFKNYIPPVAWKLSFPDPANSPVKFVRSLVVDRLSITAADAEEGGWIRGFSNVVRLEVSRGRRNLRFSFNQRLLTFSNLSPQFKIISSLFVPCPAFRTCISEDIQSLTIETMPSSTPRPHPASSRRLGSL